VAKRDGVQRAPAGRAEAESPWIGSGGHGRDGGLAGWEADARTEGVRRCAPAPQVADGSAHRRCSAAPAPARAASNR
jgi:hypothetical protein